MAKTKEKAKVKNGLLENEVVETQQPTAQEVIIEKSAPKVATPGHTTRAFRG